MCASDEDEAPSVCTRERDAFEIRVLAKPIGCGCQEVQKEGTAWDSECKCVDPSLKCYEGHYAGKCACGCKDCECECCDCDCIVLARVVEAPNDRVNPWKADHSVRRFVRPVLMRDPVVKEELAKKSAQAEAQVAAKKVTKTLSKQNVHVRQGPGTSSPGA
jgi:hypothetical protein